MIYVYIYYGMFSLIYRTILWYVLIYHEILCMYEYVLVMSSVTSLGCTSPPRWSWSRRKCNSNEARFFFWSSSCGKMPWTMGFKGSWWGLIMVSCTLTVYMCDHVYIYRVGLNAVLLGINTGACSPYSHLYSYQTWLGNPKIAELNGGLKGWFSSKPSLITGGYLILIKTYQILPGKNQEWGGTCTWETQKNPNALFFWGLAMSSPTWMTQL